MAMSPNHRWGRDYRYPLVSTLDLQVLTHFWLTHLRSHPSLWPTSHRAPPQTSLSADLLCARGSRSLQERALPDLDSSTQPSPRLGAVLDSTLSFPFSGPKTCLSLLGLFNSCSPGCNYSLSDILILQKHQFVHIRLPLKHLLWIHFFPRIKPSPIGWVSYPEVESPSLEFFLPGESKEDSVA